MIHDVPTHSDVLAYGFLSFLVAAAFLGHVLWDTLCTRLRRRLAARYERSKYRFAGEEPACRECPLRHKLPCLATGPPLCPVATAAWRRWARSYRREDHPAPGIRAL